MIAVINLAQHCTSAALQGRVSAAITLALFALQPLAQMLSAVAIGEVSFHTLYGAAALTTLGTAVWVIVAAARGNLSNAERVPR